MIKIQTFYWLTDINISKNKNKYWWQKCLLFQEGIDKGMLGKGFYTIFSASY